MSTIDYPEQNVWRPKNRTYLGTTQKEPDKLEYTGSRGELFWLAFSRMLITVCTLGIGRFWMNTRLRRFYWSSLRISGEPLEYTGRASEKLIGFMIALVILAVYLIVTSLFLAFIGFAVLEGDPAALQLLQLSIIPLFPLGFWAQYRARRYILARTRWRGIRFGLANGAWGYTVRALFWWALTILTLGLLYPLKQLKLSQFTTDRSYYGSLRFTQKGRLTPLFISWMWVWAPIALTILIGIGASVYATEEIDLNVFGDLANGENNSEGSNAALVAIGGWGMLFLLYLWVQIALIYHRVYSFRYLNSNRVLEGGARFDFRISFTSIVGIYIVGWLVIMVLAALTFAVISASGFGLIANLGIGPKIFEDIMQGNFTGLSSISALAPIIIAYLSAIAVYVALNHCFITHPLMKEVAVTTIVHDLSAADEAMQRLHDEQSEAGGFADALGADVGGAF